MTWIIRTSQAEEAPPAEGEAVEGAGALSATFADVVQAIAAANAVINDFKTMYRRYINNVIDKQLVDNRSKALLAVGAGPGTPDQLVLLDQGINENTLLPSMMDQVIAQIEEFSNAAEVEPALRTFMNNPVTKKQWAYKLIIEPVKAEVQKAQSMSQPAGPQTPQTYKAPMAAASRQDAVLAQAVPPTTPPPAPLAGPLDQGGDPLTSEPFQSLEQLKQSLLAGATGSKETLVQLYEKVLNLVGPEQEDRAKAALSKFFQGMPGGLCDLYRILQEVGLANPIDEEIVGEIMERNPGMMKDDEKQAGKADGLFLPPVTASADGKLEKTAGGYVGGAGPGYPAYIGETTNRFCPKLRNVVNTFICRYHCLDGLAIDDAQILCGEAIWRQAVMDKFSREYKDADGNWKGGYLNKRFEIHRDDGGHPYQLRPGQREKPVDEAAWSYEKRLQEMRRAEGKKRGYSPTPGDPKGLYNFDQHELLGGATPPDLSGKKRDPIAKNAAAAPFNLRTAQQDREVKVADSLLGQDWVGDKSPEIPPMMPGIEESKAYGANPETERVGGQSRTIKAGDVLFKLSEDETWTQINPYGLVGMDGMVVRQQKISLAGEPPEAYDIIEVDGDEFAMRPEAEQAPMAPTARRTFNLTKVAQDRQPLGFPTDDHGPQGKRCKKCNRNVGLDVRVCPGMIKIMGANGAEQTVACGGTDFVELSKADYSAITGAQPEKSDIRASVTFANGVFKAAIGGARGFGESLDEALKNVEELPVLDTNEALRDMMKKDEEAPRAEPKPEEPQAPAPEAPAAPADKLEDEVFDISPEEMAKVEEEEHASMQYASPQEQQETQAEADALALGPDEPKGER